MRKFLPAPLLLFVVFFFALAAPSFAGVSISVSFAPPALPVYVQPVCPGDGYIWVPGYWAYSDDAGYFWVPGTWVLPPQAGLLWTPGYWGWSGGAYIFHTGYWGPRVGFYGGINYGFGYFGNGYAGGRWDNGHFYYNRAVNNVNVTVVHNVYDTKIVNVRTENRVSFNGGSGGINARPTSEEEAAMRERHVAAVAAQDRNREAALGNRDLRASENHGKPPVAATARPGDFKGSEVVPAREAGAPYKAPERAEPNRNVRDEHAEPNHNDNAARPAPASHARDIQPAEHAAPNTGNPKLDKKYQQQQEKLDAKQARDQQKLEQKQDRDHQRLAQQKASQEKTQRVEQQHQQQTQKMVQRHAAQQQKLQQREQPHRAPEPTHPK